MANIRIVGKIEEDNCLITQQIVNEAYFTARKAMVMRRFAGIQTNHRNFYLRISQDQLSSTNDGCGGTVA